MAVKKGGLGKGLGKGLDLLISNEYVEQQETSSESSKKEETIVKIRLVEASSGQPRTVFDEDALLELAESIKKYGVIQPIIVRKKEDHYEIVAGERRWRAAKMAGIKEIPVIIKDYNEQQMAEVSLIENLQRENLNPIEEAKAYQTLIKKYNLKQEEIAEQVSKSRTVITNALRLLKLNEKVQTMLSEGLISTGHAKVLLGISDAELQTEIAERIVDEQLSVRETEKIIKKILNAEEKKSKSELPNQSLYQTIEEKMKHKIGTMVKIKRKGENKGKIEIEYYSADDLEKIIELLGINE
ncbi:MAG: ParB/RepB/Spo0J family partition protein [Fusicatenibacter sp.]|nr:ParB/RepB/Spo0J family partition protein [Fusicatenibacter sp.]